MGRQYASPRAYYSVACSRISSLVSLILPAGKLCDMVPHISVNRRQAGGEELAFNVLLDRQQLQPSAGAH